MSDTDLTKINYDKMSLWDIQAIAVGYCVSTAITDDFKEDEIRCLNPKNPLPIKKLNEWDGILEVKEPIHGDYGMNKNREIFWRTSKGEWKPIKD